MKAPFLIWLLASALPAPEQVSVRAVPDKVLLGEPFTVEVVITHPADQRIDLRQSADLGDFDLVKSSRSRIDGPGSSTTTFQLELAAFAMGKLTTPDFTFDVVAGPELDQLVAKGTAVEIASSLPPDADKTGAGIFDVRPPEVVPIRTWRLLIALAGLLGAAALAWAIYRFVNRPRPVVAEVKPLTPVHVRALAALDALRTENLPASGRGQEFYFRLSEVLRSYLGERYQFEALESTSSELLDSLRTLHTPGLPIKELTDFALDSDLAKFARAPSTPDACKASLEFAYRVVYATTPALAAPAHADRPQQLS